MKNVEDRRVKLTKVILKESLIELLNKKSINQISITELCAASDINPIEL